MVAEREGGSKPLGGALGAKVAQSLSPADRAPVRTGHPYVTPLKELCVEVVAQHFEHSPSFGKLPALYVKRIVDLLSLELPLELAGTLIEVGGGAQVECSGPISACKRLGVIISTL
jgi:hypothetical protein